MPQAVPWYAVERCGLVVPTSLPQSVLGTLDGSGKELVGLAVSDGEDGLVRVVGPGPLRTQSALELVINLKTAKSLGLTIRRHSCCGRTR